MKESNKRIKLAHLQLLPILSGVQKITLMIFQHLDLEKFDPYLICAPATEEYGGSLIEAVEELGVKVITVPTLKREISWHDFYAFSALFKIFKSNNFEIIHTHSSKTGFLGRFAAALAGCKNIIHTAHGIPFHKYQHPISRIFFYKMDILAGLFCHKIVSVNRFYVRYYRWIFGRKVTTIYNGYDFSELKQRKDRNDGGIRLVFTGRLDDQKNPFMFIEACEIAMKENPAISADIAGTGIYFEKIKEYLEKKNLLEKIRLLGWVDDIPELLSNSDIFCSSSNYEAFGLVFCEAGFTGLPSVATAVEGVPEVVLHGKTGFLVPPENPQRMAQRILTLAADKELRIKMGAAAREWVTKTFNLDDFITDYQRLYDDN